MSKIVTFIDSRLTDQAVLASLIPAGSLVFTLDAATDGVQQMAQALSGMQGVDAIHVVSHGSEGALLLGATTLDSNNVLAHSRALQTIGASLAPTGDILLYGCNVAAGYEGTAFINQLARLTSADIAASNDSSGSTVLGGNAILEKHSGVVEAKVLDITQLSTVLATINGTNLADTLEGSNSADTILGGIGSDIIHGNGGADRIEGGDEEGYSGDYLYGGPGDDTILGGQGNDYLDGEAGNDSVYGGAGDDMFSVTGRSGNDVLDGGAGKDTFNLWVYDENRAVTVRVYGGDGDDKFNVYCASWAGKDDTVTATGGAGRDTYSFYTADNAMNLFITDFQVGDNGDKIDVSELLNNTASVYKIYSGGNPFSAANGYLRLVQEGADTLLQYDADGVAGTANTWLTTTTLKNVNVANITASNISDLPPDGSDQAGLNLTGKNNGDTLLGSYFNDTLIGGDGIDEIEGSAGDDWIEGGDDSSEGSGDHLSGGIGNDTIFGNGGNDYLSGDSGNDLLEGGEGNDTLHVNVTSGGNDTLNGGVGSDTFTIWGYDAKLAQTIYANGDAGNDIFNFAVNSGLSGSLDDQIIATGGAGRDTYSFIMGNYASSVTVTDFTTGTNGDLLDVNTILNYSSEGNRGYVGGNPFSTESGYLRLIQSGADTLLQYDEDGASGTDYTWRTAITLQNIELSTITSESFVNDIDPSGLAVDGLNITGTDGEDTLTGGSFNDTLSGGGSVDRIEGNGGDDFLLGGDEPEGWSGDYLAGGAGNDTLLGGSGNDQLNGNSGNDSLDGGAGNDYFLVEGGGGQDTLLGGAGNDAFNMWVYDYTGFQSVYINAGDGDDQINLAIANWSGGDEIASITGGAGIDTYKFMLGSSAYNIFVTDFTTGVGGDYIDISALLDYSSEPQRGYSDGNPMSSQNGYLQLVQQGQDTLLQYDEDGAANTVATWHTAMTLYNVNVTDIGAYNFRPISVIGTNENDTLEGSLGIDTLSGGRGDDVLDGGWGNDSMSGGVGNDTYYVDNSLDTTKESTNQGTDTVVSDVDLTLGKNIENLQLDEHANNGNGNELNNLLSGNRLNNQLNGGSGNDTLNGGLGSDTLSGGNGDDRLLAGEGNDVIIANDAGNDQYNGEVGDDTVKYSSATQSVTVDLNTGIAVSTAGGTDTLLNIEGVIGGSANDRITGNAANNTLSGGLGSDSLAGAAGNDTYIVDVLTDVITEGRNKGTDTVQALVSFTLGDNIENLTLTGSALTGTGNGVNNILTGNAQANLLSGNAGLDSLIGGAGNDTLNGGTGADQLTGGTGDDTYFVDNQLDITNEATRAGTDTVLSTISYVLATNVENLTLTGNTELSATGNTAANLLSGNSAANTLTGGLGQDTLIGGSGADSFIFTALADSGITNTTRDVISDFTSGQDKINLSALDANSQKVGDQAFTSFISNTAVFSTAGQLQIKEGVLYGNTDNDSAAEFSIALTGVNALSVSDIIA